MSTRLQRTTLACLLNLWRKLGSMLSTRPETRPPTLVNGTVRVSLHTDECTIRAFLEAVGLLRGQGWLTSSRHCIKEQY